MFDVPIHPDITDLTIGLVEVRNLSVGPSPQALLEHSNAIVAKVRAEGSRGGDERRAAVRSMLRAGGFKPAGRNKPAQEYLLRTALSDEGLPTILNAVDALNACSLDSGLPISFVSLDRLGAELSIRYGREGERYVFNSAGQELDVRGLICLCSSAGDHTEPVGSPVKDSMRAKLTDEDHHALACIYAPSSVVTEPELQQHSAELASLFETYCGCQATSWTTGG